MAPRRRLGPDERRSQLLDVALELAAGRDLAGVSVQEIAGSAGVSEGLLYHYFPTKDALLLAAVQRAAAAMTAALDVAAQGPPLVALDAGLTAYLNHVEADPTGWRALLQARTGPLAGVAAAVEERARRLTLHHLDVVDPSPVLTAALAAWSALERELCLAWLDSPSLSRRAVQDLLLTTFLEVLRAAARHDRQAQHALTHLQREQTPTSGPTNA